MLARRLIAASPSAGCKWTLIADAPEWIIRRKLLAVSLFSSEPLEPGNILSGNVASGPAPPPPPPWLGSWSASPSLYIDFIKLSANGHPLGQNGDGNTQIEDNTARHFKASASACDNAR